MASVYKRGDKWYAKYKDWKQVDGVWKYEWKSVVGSHSKRDTENAGRRLEDEAYNRMTGNAPALPNEPTSIKDALRAYEASLTDARNTSKYVDLVIRRLEVAFETLSIKTLADCSKIKENLPAFLSLKGDGTANHYKRAIKGFLRFHKLFEIASDFKLHKVQDGEQRRSLDQAELDRLYKAAETSPKLVQGLTGRERAMLYRVAAGTGLRAGELRSLRPSSFHFDDKVKMVYVPGAHTKNGEDARQPLPAKLAERLSDWLPKSTDNELWPTNWHLKAAKMIRVDLETAKIEPETAEGVINFHSLRVSYCTSLARAGVPPTIAQKLMRHSTIQLTLETYTKFTSDEVSDAVDKLA
jgi:integrase